MNKHRQARNIRVGIIGCGTMGRIHAECYAATPGLAPVAYVNPTRAKAEELASRFGGTVYDDVAALLADRSIDAVAICSPQAHHADHILAAAGAGKHIFCEKPLALARPEFDAIERAVADAGITFMTGHQLRFHPVIAAVRRNLAKLGPVYHVNLEWCFRIAASTGRCWASYRLGGFFMELGCHATDLACFLLGRPVHVSGHTLRLNPQRITEDYTNCLIQFETGAVAQILVSANHRTKRQGLLIGRVLGEKGRIDFTVYPYQRAYNRATLVLDRGREVFVPDATARELAISRPPSPNRPYLGYFDVYYREAHAFLRAIRRQEPPPCTLADGRNAVEIVLATYHQQAKATGERNLLHPPAEYRSDADAHPLLRR